MRLKIFIFLISLVMISPIDINAQIMRRIKRAAEDGVARAVEKRVEREVEKATQRQLEKAFGNLYASDSASRVGYDFSKIMKSINMDVHTEDSYNFEGMAEMEISGTDEKGKDVPPTQLISYLSKNSEVSGMEFKGDDNQNEKTVMIFDFKNNATIMLMENKEEKSRMAFGLDWNNLMGDFENMGEVQEEDVEKIDLNDYSLKKTGNTKSILGYECEEYLLEGDEFEGTYWITNSPIEGINTFWSKNSPFITQKMQSENKYYFDNLPEGNMLEMMFKSKEDQTTSHIKFTDINPNKPIDFEMADYPNIFDQ